MVQVAKAATALILLSAGGFLVYSGLRTYFGASHSQKDAAEKWAPHNVRRHATSSITRPKANIPEGQIFSRLELPRLNESLYVVEGDNASALEKGPGHLRGSAMPGDNGNCVIAGHRDLHFRFLKDVQPGDKVYLETDQGRFCYRVSGTKVISPNQLQVLQPTPDAELHLITCYPFYFIGHSPKRFVVTAKLEKPAQSTVEFQASYQQSNLEALPAPATTVHIRRVYRAVVKRHAERSAYERSLDATRALNRVAAAGL